MDSVNTAKISYYDLVKNWRKVKPYINHPNVQQAIETNFTPYSVGYFGHPLNGKTIEGLYKEQLELQMKFFQDDCDDARKGKRKPYWMFVKHGSCHWSANVALELAKLVEPSRPWRLVTGSKHSTVWDGDRTLFEFNYYAFDIPAQECFETASVDAKDVKVGEQNEAGITSPFFVPIGFRAKDSKNWDEPMKMFESLTVAARHYLNELGNTIRRGVIEDVDLSLAASVQYELAQQFITHAEKNQLSKSAKVLESLATFESSKATKSINRKAEKVVTRLVEEVNKTGNVIIFATPTDIQNQEVRAGFRIHSDRIESATETENPLEELGKWVRFSAVARWDLLMLVRNNRTNETRSWKFDNFEAQAVAA